MEEDILRQIFEERPAEKPEPKFRPAPRIDPLARDDYKKVGSQDSATCGLWGDEEPPKRTIDPV